MHDINSDIKNKNMAKNIDAIIDNSRKELFPIILKWIKTKDNKETVILSDAIYKKIREMNRLQRQRKMLKVKNFFSKLLKDIRRDNNAKR